MFWRLAPRLDETDAYGRIFREPRGDHRASRASTYDYEIKRLFLSHGLFLSLGVGSMGAGRGIAESNTATERGV